ncbi:MAG: ASCH domain-containing protein [Planctomycetes bacterium]|nr:ASCH domain-containing protein [Planctomycetota bacterium]
MLLFKKKFLPAIRRGEKTQTIRLWRWRMMRSGQRSYIPGIGYIRIDCVEQVELNQLTDQDAIPDGFDTADALRQEINTLYREKIDAGYSAFRVVFRILEDAA